ncbi:sigma factor-like helix-turn-helix DNA-binding protein [Corynebacterium mendelii]|uniref:sigma factor-like helix-turn-helix DNA-binding protein n=1 Tax=Corynebacterium mendelii TaxID=2765362 RepID=UPI0036411D1B
MNDSICQHPADDQAGKDNTGGFFRWDDDFGDDPFVFDRAADIPDTGQIMVDPDLFPWAGPWCGLTDTTGPVAADQLAGLWCRHHVGLPLERLSPAVAGLIGSGVGEPAPGGGTRPLGTGLLGRAVTAGDSVAAMEAATFGPSLEVEALVSTIVAAAGAAPATAAPCSYDQAIARFVLWLRLHGRGPARPYQPGGQLTDRIGDLCSTLHYADPVAQMVTATVQSLPAADDLDHRVTDIIARRLQGATLQELGDCYGLSRERIRQLEATFVTPLTNNRHFSRLVDTLVYSIDPVTAIDHLCAAAPGIDTPLPVSRTSLVEVILKTTGALETTGDLIHRPGFRQQLDAAVDQATDPAGTALVDDYAAAAGLDTACVPAVLETMGIAHLIIGDRIAFHVANRQDRVASVLHITGEPMTIEQLLAATGDTGNPRGFANVMYPDDRLVRLSKDTWGLASWGREEYTTIVDLIDRRVGDGSYPYDRMVEELTGFGVAPSAVYLYCRGFDFTVENGRVIRRTTPVSVHQQPEMTPGLYHIGDSWLLRAEVTADHLRGSGIGLSTVFATIYNLSPRGSVELATPLGDVQTLRWKQLYNTQLSTIRRFFTLRGLKEGDRMWLIFGPDSFDVQPCSPRRPGLQGWPGVLNDMGADAVPPGLGQHAAAGDHNELGIIAAAIGLEHTASHKQVVERLKQRGEDQLAARVDELG